MSATTSWAELPVLPPKAAERLAKMAGMLGSNHAGERAAAAAAATRLLRAHGLTWREVLLLQAVPPARPDPGADDWRGAAAACLARPDLLTQWEARFLRDLLAFPRVSPKQAATLDGIVARHGRAP